jgi:hypothetical protein
MANNQQLLMGEGAGGAPVVYVEDVFSTYLYTGNGTSQTITNNIDLSTKGGMVWFKCRSNPTNHLIFDTVRGRASAISPTTTAGAGASSASNEDLVSFNATGFSLGIPANYDLNTSSRTYASWTFRKQPKFFDIVTWTGNGVIGRTISHNLGSVPGCIIVKKTTQAGDWPVYHAGLGATKAMILNLTDSVYTWSVWDNTAPTSTVFSLNDASEVNGAGQTYVAYLFAHNAGGFGLAGTDNVISCGSFTTDGSGNASVNLGYEPQWVMYKRTDSATGGNWNIYDTMRGWSQTQWKGLFPNTSGAEGNSTTSANDGFRPTATGFDAIATSSPLYFNATYIYIAIRRGPMKVPTVGTSVFSPVFRQGTSTVVQVASGFVTDLGITQSTQNGYSTGGAVFYDRLRGCTSFLSPSGSSAESTYTTLVQGFDTQSGVIMAADTSRAWTNFLGAYPNDNYEFYANWFFKRAPGFMDVVCYTGNGGSPQVVTHNLTVVPEMIIVKARSIGYQWIAYHSGLGTGSYIQVDSTAASVAYAAFPAVSTTTFSANSSYNRASGETYVAYLFATCAGVSKVGSYTGTGTTLQINCGFTAGARWVMIKRTDSTGNWFVWDSARGIVAGNDPYLVLNTTDAQVTNTDYIDTYNAGFEISSTAPAAINASAGTFIFLAIA